MHHTRYLLVLLWNLVCYKLVLDLIHKYEEAKCYCLTLHYTNEPKEATTSCSMGYHCKLNLNDNGNRQLRHDHLGCV